MRININKACTNPQAKITPKRQSPRAYRSGIRTLKSPSKACFPANVRKPTNARKKALRGRFCVSQRHRIQPVETNHRNEQQNKILYPPRRKDGGVYPTRRAGQRPAKTSQQHGAEQTQILAVGRLAGFWSSQTR